MILQLSENEIYFLQDKEITIVEDYYPFNMALVKYINSNESFIIDTNFLRKVPSNEEYIKIEFKR
ncbi:hypothetical protein [Lysinibacillus sphaericus]|uniref:hypothetical protein n=1 Tax=Lysinibacillus sphaericus TaxID=1421 RepID=UPI003D75F91C